MILKVNTKRTAGGKLVETGLQQTDWLYEGEKIFIARENDGFAFTIIKDEKVTETNFNDRQFGYSILNDAGVIIERQFTTVD